MTRYNPRTVRRAEYIKDASGRPLAFLRHTADDRHWSVVAISSALRGFPAVTYTSREQAIDAVTRFVEEVTA